MKNKISVLIISLLMLLSSLIIPQSSTFTIEAYKQFLSTHQNMNAGDVLQLHNAGTFLGQIPAQTQTTLFNRSIALNFNMRAKAKLL